MFVCIFLLVMEKIHKHQVEKVLPYQYEPEASAETSNFSDESDSEDGSVLSSCEEEVHTEFERANAWRLETLSFCKCGYCALSTNVVEYFAATRKLWSRTNTECFWMNYKNMVKSV